MLTELRASQHLPHAEVPSHTFRDSGDRAQSPAESAEVHPGAWWQNTRPPLGNSFAQRWILRFLQKSCVPPLFQGLLHSPAMGQGG